MADVPITRVKIGEIQSIPRPFAFIQIDNGVCVKLLLAANENGDIKVTVSAENQEKMLEILRK